MSVAVTERVTLRTYLRLLTMWLAVTFATFVATGASADPAPPSPGIGRGIGRGFAGASGTGTVQLTTGVNPPATGRVGAGNGSATTSGTVTATGAVTTKPPSLVSRITSTLTAPIRQVTNTLSNAPAPPLPPNFYAIKGFGEEAWDFVKGTVGFVANTDATITRGIAGLSTGNLTAAKHAWNDSQAVQMVSTTVRGLTTSTRMAAAEITGNDTALVNAARESPIFPVVMQASTQVPQLLNTIQHGTAQQRLDLLNQGSELSGRLTFEALLFAVPGGAEVRAPTLAIKTEEVLADASRLSRLPELADAARGEEALAGRSALDDADLVTNCKGELCRRGESTNCFAAGTPVLTPDGERPIEDIRVGDIVLSRDPNTFEVGAHRVARTFVTPDHEVAELDLESDGAHESFVVTPEHPFFVEGRGFRNVIDLAPGDVVVTATGTARVERLLALPRSTTVFNFEVETDHTYFVGHTGAWVHNDCAPRPGEEVLVPRSDGSISPGRVRGSTPDGRLIVEVPGGGTKIVDPRTLTRPKPPRAFGDPYGSIEDGYANLGSSTFRSHLATAENALPTEGWKLHVSASPAQSYAVADRVLPLLRRLGVHHKIVTNPEKYARLTGTQTGKFITIYPRDAAEAKRVVDALRPVLGSTTRDAPLIAGEQSLGDGIYTRYGGFTKSTVTGPDGREVPDVRGQISPPWIRFPF